MDLDFWLRLLDRRVVIGVAAALAGGWFLHHEGDYWKAKVDMSLNPPASPVSPLADDILKDAERVAAARVRGLHKTVTAEISKARAEGFEVDQLQLLADDALARDSALYREVAIKRLNELRVKIPQKRGFAKTASSEDQNPDLNDAPQPKTKYKAGRRRGR